MLLGCIADDFTGATDLANNLVQAGMRVVQTIGVPAAGEVVDADAVVVALKSRTIEPAVAVAQSLAALQWLRSQGARQIYFKVCSTFDSTDRGNIGPVAEALMAALACDFTIACPAFPDNGRVVFKGHLFVGDDLLSDSGMRHHPLTPMTDSNLVRVMQRQCRQPVGLIDYRVLRGGEDAIRKHIAALRGDGVRLAIVDATSNDDLMVMGRVFAGLPLVVAGSGVAIGLPQNFGLAPRAEAAQLPAAAGAAAIVSGSCSQASNAQVKHFLASAVQHGGAAFSVDPLAIAAGEDVAGAALRWAEEKLGRPGKGGELGKLGAPGARAEDRPLLFYATAEAGAVQEVQRTLGAGRAGELVERTLAAIARGLVERGVGRLVVAGGETSGACVQALGIERLRIGPQIDPGVPWCHAQSPAARAGQGGALHLALKSGNFGGPDFFTRAFTRLA